LLLFTPQPCARISARYNEGMSPKYTHYTANDITPNRCTITGRFASMAQAQAAIESDDESGYFEAASAGDASDMAIGTLACHLNGVCWRAE
jgi:hypothetical protein